MLYKPTKEGLAFHYQSTQLNEDYLYEHESTAPLGDYYRYRVYDKDKVFLYWEYFLTQHLESYVESKVSIYD